MIRQTTLEGEIIPRPYTYSIRGDPNVIAVKLRRRGFSVYHDTTICDDAGHWYEETAKFAYRRGGNIVVCEVSGVPYGLAVMGDKDELLAFLIAESLRA